MERKGGNMFREKFLRLMSKRELATPYGKLVSRILEHLEEYEKETARQQIQDLKEKKEKEREN